MTSANLNQSYLERQFEDMWTYYYPRIDLIAEYRAIPMRKFRFDYAHLKSRVLIELNGGIWQQMGHSSGRGISRDYEKYNLATAFNWKVFVLSDSMVNEEWLAVIAKTIKRGLKDVQEM